MDKTVEMKVIQAVNETTDWVNYLVLEEKPNVSPRIFIDPKELNKLLNDPTMPIQLERIYCLE